jgi:hypothetical protein
MCRIEGCIVNEANGEEGGVVIIEENSLTEDTMSTQFATGYT